MKNNLYIFPLIKKTNKNIDKEEVSTEEVDKFVNHYMGQLAEHLEKHGFDLNKRFLRDYDFAYEFLRSSLLRNVGQYHPFQDYVDDFDDFVEEQKEES